MTQQETKANEINEAVNRAYGLSDLMGFTGISRGEAEQWTRRGIIAPPPVEGRGHHRKFDFFNMLEGLLAGIFADKYRMPAGKLEQVMTGLRQAVNDMPQTGASPVESLVNGDWTAVIRMKDDEAPAVNMYSGGFPGNVLLPVVTVVSVSRIANDLLADILEEPEGSWPWRNRTLAARKKQGADNNQTQENGMEPFPKKTDDQE